MIGLEDDLGQYHDVVFRKLGPQDFNNLDQFFKLIRENGIEKDFHPHPFDRKTAAEICQYSGQDWFAGAFLERSSEEKLVGYVMLRGWDEGYSIPSFGICVIPPYQGLGIGKILLSKAILVARLRNSSAVRLKVYPENLPAISMYQRAGFKFLDDLEDGQMVGILELKTRISL